MKATNPDRSLKIMDRLRRLFLQTFARSKLRIGARLTVDDLSALIVGKGVTMFTRQGRQKYLDLDYTATKPILEPVRKLLFDFYEYRA